jgi:hypothetical protein
MSKPEWSMLFATNKKIYVLGRFSQSNILASYGFSSIPREFQLKLNAASFVHAYNRTHQYYNSIRETLLSFKNEQSILKAPESFECSVCLEENTLFTPLSCFHRLCSSCYSDIIFIKNECPICRCNISDNKNMRKKYKLIPVSYIAWAMSIIGLIDKTNINYIVDLN